MSRSVEECGGGGRRKHCGSPKCDRASAGGAAGPGLRRYGLESLRMARARAFMSSASARALARRITAVTGHLEPGMARPKVVVTRQLGGDAMRLLDRADLDVRRLSSRRDHYAEHDHAVCARSLHGTPKHNHATRSGYTTISLVRRVSWSCLLRRSDTTVTTLTYAARVIY